MPCSVIGIFCPVCKFSERRSAVEKIVDSAENDNYIRVIVHFYVSVTERISEQILSRLPRDSCTAYSVIARFCQSAFTRQYIQIYIFSAGGSYPFSNTVSEKIDFFILKFHRILRL